MIHDSLFWVLVKGSQQRVSKLEKRVLETCGLHCLYNIE